MPSPTIYSTGTATVVAGQTAVAGIGTVWSGLVKAGSHIFIGGSVGLVASVASDTALTLASPWAGTNQTAQPYAISIPPGDSAELAIKARALIEAYQGRAAALVLAGATLLKGGPTNTPPGSPTTGDRYIVGSSPTGSWSGQGAKIAEWSGSAWTFTSPTAPAFSCVSATGATYIWDGLAWSALGGSAGTNISFTRDGTTVTVVSDTGADAVLPGASTSNAGVMVAADKTKLDGIATGATANSSDATLLARANHTGTQLASTISDFSEAVDDRVAVLIVAGTGISSTYNDGANTLTIAQTLGLKAKITADVGPIANSETQVVAYSVPANSLAVGSTFRIKAAGRHTQDTTSVTGSYKIKFGGAAIAEVTIAYGTTARTASEFDLDFTVTVRSTGATGTAIGAGVTNQSLAVNLGGAKTSAVTIDTTATATLELTYISGGANTSETFSVATIEQLA